MVRLIDLLITPDLVVAELESVTIVGGHDDAPFADVFSCWLYNDIGKLSTD